MSTPYDTELLKRSDAANILHPASVVADVSNNGPARIFVEGKGAFITDTDGNRMLDGVGGLWCMNIGYGRTEIGNAMKAASTIATASLTGLASFHRNFGLPIPEVKHSSLPHYYREAKPGESEEQFSARLANELEDLIIAEGPETVGAFIAEPIMGAGGVITPPKGYFKAVQAVFKNSFFPQGHCATIIC